MHRDIETWIEQQLCARGIADKRVLHAFRCVPRAAFVPDALRDLAFEDRPLPIGSNQTISQPYIVARMLELAQIEHADRVLEVGAGSGYAAALASLLAKQVFGVERHENLASAAQDALSRLGYGNVLIVHGDGTRGLAEYAPFDAIIVSAASEQIPPALLQQLAPGGRLVIPVGTRHGQRLLRVTRAASGDRIEEFDHVQFVPLIAGASDKRT